MIFYDDPENPMQALIRFLAALTGKDFCISCGILHDDTGSIFCIPCGEALAE